MHARVTIAQVRPGELLETMYLLRESLYPALKQMNGFQGGLLLTNPNTEKVIGVALWETEADIPHVTPPNRDAAFESTGRRGFTRRFFEASPLERMAVIPLLGQAAREIYEVRIQAEATSGGEPTHARVLTAQVQPGNKDEVVGIAQDFEVPILKQRKGFKSYLGLTDGSTGTGLMISLWETEADERAWEIDSKYQELAARLRPLITGLHIVERYEVSVQV